MSKPKLHLAHNPMATVMSAMPKCGASAIRPIIVRRHNQVTCKNCLKLITKMKSYYLKDYLTEKV